MSFWGELRRRNVVRVGLAYLAAAWLTVQVAETVLVTFDAPAWVMQALVAAGALGFPFVLILTWVYEWTPEGLKVTRERTAGQGPVPRRRRFDPVVTALMALAIVFLVVDNYVLDDVTSMASISSVTGTVRARPSACAAPAGAPAPSIVALTFDGGMKWRPRISPDGSMVTFAWAPSGPSDVYVKQIGRNTAPIRITDHPFADGEASWSPDSSELVYTRDEHGDWRTASIYVVPALGGHATKIVDRETVPKYPPGALLGAVTWSPNGPYLVYADRASAGAPSRLIELDRSTGAKRVLGTPPTATDAVGDFEPAFSPRGDRIAFVRAPTSGDSSDIWVMNADGSGERQITNGRWGQLHTLSWTHDGEALLFTAGGALNMRSYCVDLDEGIPRPLPGLGENEAFATVASDPAGADRVVFAKWEFDPLRMFEAPGRLADSRDAPPRDVREGNKIVFSPNGDRFAWQSHRTGRPQVWIDDRDGTSARQLTDQKVDAFNPQWSIDGKRIAFYSSDAGSADIYVVEVDSGRVTRLTFDPAADRYPTFSRDGRWIYFSSNRSGRSEIYRMPVDGGDAVPITDTGGTIAFESHDGRQLYYEYLEGNNGHTTEANPIWRIPVDGDGVPEIVLPGWWRPENTWVLVPSGIYYLRNAGDNFSLRYHAFDTGEDVEILSGTGPAWYPGVSPDEKSVFYVRNLPGPMELYVLENFR